MTPRQKIFLLIQQFSNGDLSFNDFCSEYFSIFELECFPNDFTFVEWNMCRELSDAIEMYSPFEEDVRKYPDVYKSEEQISESVSHIYEFIANGEIV